MVAFPKLLIISANNVKTNVKLIGILHLPVYTFCHFEPTPRRAKQKKSYGIDDTFVKRFLPEPALSVNSNPAKGGARFARNDRSEGVEMPKKGLFVQALNNNLRYLIIEQNQD